MVEFTPELLAILGYTAFALFLSLYYVPFKVVPKAWAKAIKTVGHAARIALFAVLDEVADKIVEKIITLFLPKIEAMLEARLASITVPTLDEIKAQMPVVPEVPDFQTPLRAMHGQLNARLTAELKPIKDKIEGLQMPVIPPFELPKTADGKSMLEVVEGLRKSWNEAVPLINNLSADTMVQLMKNAYSDMRKAEIARGDLGPDGDLTAAQKEEIAALVKNPDGKAQLVAAENAIDAAVGMKLLKETTGKALKKQLNGAFASGQDPSAILAPYKALLDRALGLAEGAPSVALRTGGAPAGRRLGT